MPTRTSHLPAVLLTLSALTLGCSTSPTPAGDWSLEIRPTNPKPNQLVTVTVPGEFADRATAIDWITTGGSLTTEQNARVARLRFPKPGEYTVTAKLMSRAQEFSRASSKITVE